MPSTRPPATPSPGGASQESDTAPSSLALPAAAAAATLARSASSSERLPRARDQNPAAAASGRVLVGDRDLAQPRLGLAELHQRLKRRIGERLALEERHDARVGGGVLRRAGAG